MWTHALDSLSWLVTRNISNGVYFDLRSADRATPFSDTLGKISPRWENPFAATVACLIITTVLGFIYLGSAVVSIPMTPFLCAIISRICTAMRMHDEMMPGNWYSSKHRASLKLRICGRLSI